MRARGRVAFAFAAVVAWTVGAAPAAAFTAPAFTVGALPKAVGVPYAPSVTRNEDVEPGMGIAGDGTIWVGSNIDVNSANEPRAAVALAGEDIWKSTDGGKTFQWVAAPFNVSSSNAGLGGEDSDLAVAPEKNAGGFYNVYATSLYVAQSNVAISQDGGQTWTTMSIGSAGQLPAQDRPWLSADGPCTFYLTYHQLPFFSPVVNKYDVCNPANIGVGIALNPVQSTSIFLNNTAPGLTNGFNKPFVDNSSTSAKRHNVYVPMEACNLANPSDYINNVIGTAEQIPLCPPGVNTYVEVAASTDGGSTFNVYKVADNTNGEQQVWPTSLGIDQAGNVLVAWSDNHHSFFSKSTDGGVTWTARKQVDPPAGTSVYPTIAGGAPGEVELSYYGTAVTGDSNDAAKMGTPGARAAAPWHLYWAKSTDGGGTFNTVQVTGVNHTGVLCTMGSACSAAGSRNLYDDFGLAISPTTGLGTIIFDADQPMTAPPGAAAVDPYTAYATEVAAAVTASPRPVVTGGGGGTPNTSTGDPSAPFLLVGMLLAAGLLLAGRRRARG